MTGEAAAIDYGDEIALLPRRKAVIARWLVSGVVLLAIPLLAGDYLVTQLNFVLIYAIAGLGLQLLMGYTGQLSLAHAAFLAIGAYGCAYLEQHGITFALAALLAIVITTAVGVVAARPALRVSGNSLMVATIAVSFIIQEIATRWTAVTGGNSGMSIPPIQVLGVALLEPRQLYYLYLPLLLAGLWIAANALRSPLGRAMMAVRDSEVAARSIGVDVARTKTIAFGLSAAYGGLAGALYAHQITYISPEQFGLDLSLELTIMLMVGGVASLPGVVLGAIFTVMLPEALGFVFQLFGAGGSGPTGVRPIIEGGALILIMLFEPFGIYGIWLRLRGRLSRGPVSDLAARE
jgi:branched-chain amino acid transport system permease protein